MNSDDKDERTKSQMTNQTKAADSGRANLLSAKPSAGPTEGAKSPATQDRWFDIQLGRMYSDLAAEPVPQDMLALIGKLRATEK